MQDDDILNKTYEVIENHKNGNDGFQTLCRLLYKSIDGSSKNDEDYANILRIEKNQIKSNQEDRSVGSLYLLKENMPRKHYRMNKDLSDKRKNNPIIILSFQGKEWLIDGSTRINTFFAEGDLSKKLVVNIHQMD